MTTNQTSTPVLTQSTLLPVLRSLFSKRGDSEYLGEPVTLSAHMLQCAQLAEEQGDSTGIVVAALLHDIGHLNHQPGSITGNDKEDHYHEESGARLLEPVMPSLVVDCIRFHVPAKRYLCHVEPSYFNALSEASVHSLGLQGGPMSHEEAKDFEKNPNLDAIIKVRRYDDIAKFPDQKTPDFEHYAPMVEQVANNHG